MLSFQGLVQAAKTSDGIMVWKLELKSGVTQDDIDSISGFVTLEVEKHSGKKAVSDADIHTILKGEEAKQQCGVDGTSCIAEIGSALGVPEAISGDLGRMGDYWILNLRRINVRRAEVIARSGPPKQRGRKYPGGNHPPVPWRSCSARPCRSPPFLLSKRNQPRTKPNQAQSKRTPKPPMSVLCKAAYGTFFSGVALVALGGVGQWQMGVANDDFKSGDTNAESTHAMWKGISAHGLRTGRVRRWPRG